MYTEAGVPRAKVYTEAGVPRERERERDISEPTRVWYTDRISGLRIWDGKKNRAFICIVC